MRIPRHLGCDFAANFFNRLLVAEAAEEFGQQASLAARALECYFEAFGIVLAREDLENYCSQFGNKFNEGFVCMSPDDIKHMLIHFTVPKT